MRQLAKVIPGCVGTSHCKCYFAAAGALVILSRYRRWFFLEIPVQILWTAGSEAGERGLDCCQEAESIGNAEFGESVVFGEIQLDSGPET